MVNFHDPVVLVQDRLILAKLCQTIDGLYIWEVLTTLDYEWRVIQGRQPYRWTIWIYSFARLATLMIVITDMVVTSNPIHINPQVLVTFNFILAYMTFASSSLLIVLRVIAVWNRNKVVVALTSILWGVNVSFFIYGIIRIRPTWDPGPDSGISNIESNKAAIISMFITDFILLVIMLFGLHHMSILGSGTFALGRMGRLLWKQGAIWLLVATAAELPPAVFVCLDLNDAFNIMFIMPSLVMMSIAATRMYSSLAAFYSNDVAMDWENPPRIDNAFSNPKPTFIVPLPPRRMEVAVPMARETSPTLQADQNELYIGNDRPGQLHEEQDGLSFDNHVESDIDMSA